MGQLRTGIKDGIISVLDEGDAGAQVYEATLTQTSTDAPVATVLFNSIPTTMTWARSNTGIYTVTAGAAAFTANKTQLFIGGCVGAGGVFGVTRTSTTVLTIYTRDDTFTLADALLTETAIRIVIFP